MPREYRFARSHSYGNTRESAAARGPLLIDIPVGGLVHPPEFVALVATYLLVVGFDVNRLVQRDLRHQVGQSFLGDDVLVFSIYQLHREPRLVKRLVQLRVTGVGCVLPDAVVRVTRDLGAVGGGGRERVGLSRVAVIAGVHGEIEVVGVDHATTGARGEHPQRRHIRERLDDLDADGGQGGGDEDFLLFTQWQRGGDQVELYAAPLRVGPEAFAWSRVLELVAGVVEQLVGRRLIVLGVLGIRIEAPRPGLNANQGVGRHDGPAE